VHLKENGFSQSFRVFCSVPIKNMKPVSENRLNLFPVFVFLLIFVFCDFVFKTSSKTPHYGYKTCFVVLETENCFQNRLPNRLYVRLKVFYIILFFIFKMKEEQQPLHLL
jgi:hypothetical protein